MSAETIPCEWCEEDGENVDACDSYELEDGTSAELCNACADIWLGAMIRLDLQACDPFPLSKHCGTLLDRSPDLMN